MAADLNAPAAAENDSMDLSIVIISWNTCEVLRECLASIPSSGPYAESEIIVVDNGSTDGSPEMVKAEFPNVRLLRNTGNVGFAAANNQAIALARGEFLLLLNSDTQIRGEVLQKSVEYMAAHPGVGVMGCRVLNPDGTLQRTCFQFPSLTNLVLLTTGLEQLPWPRWLGRQQMRHWARDDEREVDVVTGCYMMVRREAMSRVGTLDEAFFFCGEETDWCRRFRKAGWKCMFAPVGEIIHIGNASGRQRKHFRDVMLTEGLVRYHRKHGGAVAAAAAWLILLTFNASRWLGWAGVAMVRRSEPARRRRDHFRAVVHEFGRTWPRPSGVPG